MKPIRKNDGTIALPRPVKPRTPTIGRAAAVMGLALIVWPLLLPSAAGGETSAVASRLFNGYQRTKLPDGSFKPETYALGNGGRFDVASAGDGIDKTSFLQIAQTLARPLASRSYRPSRDPEQTDLLILVFWGTTQSTQDKPTAYELTEKTNARILGFGPDLQRVESLDFTTMSQDLRDELEASRYFVVLKAFDFRTAWKEKKLKVLWETRFSLQVQGNDFEENLPGMAQYAARFFGRDTQGLVRPETNEGQVELGEMKILGYEPAK